MYLFFIYVIIPKKNAELFGLVNRFTEKKMSEITKRALENSLKSLLLKAVLKKVKGTDVEILLKESGLIE